MALKLWIAEDRWLFSLCLGRASVGVFGVVGRGRSFHAMQNTQDRRLVRQIGLRSAPTLRLVWLGQAIQVCSPQRQVA